MFEKNGGVYKLKEEITNYIGNPWKKTSAPIGGWKSSFPLFFEKDKLTNQPTDGHVCSREVTPSQSRQAPN